MSPIEMLPRFLIVVPLALLFLLVLTVSVIIVLKWQLWRMSQRRAKLLAHMIKFRPDGLPYPPAGRGMCDSCEKAHEKVYHLPSGRRLCTDCYESLEMNNAAPDDRAGCPLHRQVKHDNVD